MLQSTDPHDTDARVRDVLACLFRDDMKATRVAPDDALDSLKIDDCGWGELSGAVEHEFGIVLHEEVLRLLPTVSALTSLVRRIGPTRACPPPPMVRR